MPLREYAGNAKRTTLSADITAGSTTITGADFTNWPTGVPGNFFIIIDRGLSNEEKILVSSRSGNTLTVAGSGRGADSTSAAAHTSGAFIEHGLTATDIREVNDHTFDTTNDDHTQYLNNARHDIEARHTFGAALGTAQAGAVVTVTAGTAGTGANPAREDHTHKGTGTLDYVQSSTSEAAFSAETTLFTLTVTTLAGRRYKLTHFESNPTHSVAADTFGWRMKEDGVTFNSMTVRVPANDQGGAMWSSVRTPTAASHTYIVTAARLTGTGTETMNRAATELGWFLIEDIGV